MNFPFAQRKICELIINKLQKCYRKEECKDNSQYNVVLAIKVMARDVVVCCVPYTRSRQSLVGSTFVNEISNDLIYI